jgi:hypothetical protein
VSCSLAGRRVGYRGDRFVIPALGSP